MLIVELQHRRPQFDTWARKICWRWDRLPTPVFLDFPCGSAGKRICPQCGRPRFDPWVGKIPWRKGKATHFSIWPREFHGLCSPWGRKESDTTECVSLHLNYPWITIEMTRGIRMYLKLNKNKNTMCQMYGMQLTQYSRGNL